MSQDIAKCRCGAEEGQVHKHFMCDFENCPFCGHQLSTCDCVYEILDIRDKRYYGPETAYLPPDVFMKGLTNEQREQWLRVCEARGRVPFMLWPNICGRCGELWPEMFHVSDEEWKKYVEIRERHRLLCRKCYDEIKELIDRVEKVEVSEEAVT